MAGRLLSRSFAPAISGAARQSLASRIAPVSACVAASSCRHASTSYEGSILLQSQEKGVRRLVLNNEKKRNALSFAMLEALATALSPSEDPRLDERLSCVVISARGKVFSAGHDLTELKAPHTSPTPQELFELCSYVMMTIKDFPVPVIAEVSGLATAAGCQLVASCDMVIAGESARFATPGVNIGLFCTTPSVPVMQCLPDKQSMYMLFTGEALSARDAWLHGLVSKVVPDDELEKATNALTGHLTSLSRNVLMLGKSAVLDHRESRSTDQAYKVATTHMVKNVAMEDCQEGIDAFFGKRKPKWNKK